jgi:uncharacterized delta-60 repeat protein
MSLPKWIFLSGLVLFTLFSCKGLEEYSEGAPAGREYSPTGTVDTSFGGGDGFSSYNLYDDDDLINGIAIDSQDRIVATGIDPSSDTLVVVRFNKDGSVDSSFNGGNGRVLIKDEEPLLSGSSEGLDIAIDSSGNIHAVGYHAGYGLHIKLDKNGNYVSKYEFKNQSAPATNSVIARTITIDDADYVFIGGWDTTLDFPMITKLQYLLDAIDEQKVINDVTGEIRDIFFNNDNDLIAIGTNLTSNISRIWKLQRANLAIDSSADIPVLPGENSQPYRGYYDKEHNIIYLTGKTANAGDEDMFFAKFSSPSDNNKMVRVIDAVTGEEAGTSIVADAHGNIIVAGFSNYGAPQKMTLWKFDASGNVETSFGSSGYVQSDIGRGAGIDMKMDSEGKLLIGGYIDNGTDWDMALWKYK